MRANLEKVENIAAEVAEELGYELYRVQMMKERGRSILRITIDHDEGINHQDCEKYSRAIDPLLDQEDPIPYSYYLEVSSPGLYRQLYNENDYQKHLGSFVKVVCRRGVAGARTHRGTLASFDHEYINLTIAEQELKIPRELIKSVKLDIPEG